MFVMCVPPVDDQLTLVHGGSTINTSTALDYVLASLGNRLHLKRHQADIVVRSGLKRASTRLPLGVQVHQCDDGRKYVTELGHLFPLEGPVTLGLPPRLLRPELLLSSDTAISGGAFCSAKLGQ